MPAPPIAIFTVPPFGTIVPADGFWCTTRPLSSDAHAIHPTLPTRRPTAASSRRAAACPPSSVPNPSRFGTRLSSAPLPLTYPRPKPPAIRARTTRPIIARRIAKGLAGRRVGVNHLWRAEDAANELPSGDQSARHLSPASPSAAACPCRPRSSPTRPRRSRCRSRSAGGVFGAVGRPGCDDVPGVLGREVDRIRSVGVHHADVQPKRAGSGSVAVEDDLGAVG